jgi:hypothetical protein
MDLAEKQLEQFICSSQEDMVQKMHFLQNLVVKYNVVLPNINSLKQQITSEVDSDDFLES